MSRQSAKEVEVALELGVDVVEASRAFARAGKLWRNKRG
jgi:hypothetical protein